MKLTNLTVKTKLWVLAATPLVVLVAVALWGMKVMEEIQNDARTMYVDRVVPLEDLKGIADDYAVLIPEAVNKANAGLISAEEALSHIREARERTDELWQQFNETEFTAREATLAREARTLFDRADREIDRLEDHLAGLSGTVAGELDEFDGPLYTHIDPITAKLNELIHLQLEVAEALYEHAHAGYVRSLTLFSGITVVSIVIVGLLAWFIGTSIRTPLERLRATMERSTRDSDLTVSVDVQGHDEIAEAGRAFNAMIERFRGLLSEVLTITSSLASSAEELSAVSDQSRSNVERQNNEVQQISTAVEEMSATIREVARNTSETADTAGTANENVAASSRVVGNARDSVDTLARSVGEAAEEARQLLKDGERISQVLDVITGVAEKTNLLALNAAIEAARAGEHGRGFSVVAEEVRNLASQTQQSTGEIQATIEQLQTRVSTVVQAVEAGQTHASESVEGSQEAVQALADIARAVERISEMASSIASATEEQGTASEQIAQSVSQVSELAEQSAEGTAQTNKAGNELAATAGRLREMVEQFRT
ncbi:methyl-accepting chemotaxis protein [Arhodomonas sp. AD133]|uniref:methyl-accepting chemotaxis protein n=1 Tax=Arhodomonas sp. AD133 TaxID=3415009 RepID=UPI003EBFF7EC